MTLPGHRPLLPIPGYRRVYSNAQLAGIELTDGALLPVSNADEARIRFNLSLNQLQASLDAGSYSAILTAEGFGLFRPEWYGAVGDGVHDDTTAIQTAVDAAIDWGGGTVLMTPGRQYLITAPIIAGLMSGGLWTYSTWAMRCFQGKASTSFIDTGAVIRSNMLDLPILIIQAGAGVLIEGVRFIGPNAIAAGIYADPYDSLLDDTNFYVPGLRMNARSPQAGIVTDPFHPAVVGANQYPGMGSYYVGGGYSSQLVIRDCVIMRNAVGVSWSPHAQSANNDNGRIESVDFEENRVGFQVLGSQARNIQLVRCNWATEMFCVANLPVEDFDTGYCGTPPRVLGGCIGSSKYCFAVSPLADVFPVWGLYVESTLSIGFIGTTQSANMLPASFNGCDFDLFDTSEERVDTHLFACAPTTFRDCLFGTSTKVICVYDVASDSYSGRVNFEDTKFMSHADQLSMSANSPDHVVVDGCSQFINPFNLAWYDGPMRVERVPLGSAITIVNNGDGTADFTATVGVMPTVNTGDYVCISESSVSQMPVHTYDPGAYNMHGAIGYVSAVAGFDVTISGIAQSLVGAANYTLEIVRAIPSSDSANACWSGDRHLTDVGSPHAALSSDAQVGIDTTTAVATYTLPPVASSRGRNIFIYDEGQNASVNAITVAAQGGETINGVASIDITTDGAGAWCKCDGAVWKTVSVA